MYYLHKGSITGNIIIWRQDTIDPDICWIEQVLIRRQLYPSKGERWETKFLEESQNLIAKSEDKDELIAIAILNAL